MTESCKIGQKRGWGALKAVVFLLISAVALAVNAVVTVIPENTTLYIGGSGADPYNGQGSFIIFNPGSTLVVTQTQAKSVWAALIATNGAATLRFDSKGANVPYINSHLFAHGNGSLNIESANTVYTGHSLYCPFLSMENLSISGGGQIRLKALSSVVSFPDPSVNFLVEGETVIWLCGENMFAKNSSNVSLPVSDDSVTLNRAKWILANAAAVSPSKTIHVTKSGLLNLCARVVPDMSDIVANFPQRVGFQHSTGVVTNYNNIVLETEMPDVPALVFTNKADFVFAGSLSGTGVVEVSGWDAVYALNTRLTVGLAGDNSSFYGDVVLKKPFVDLSLDSPNAAGNARIVPAVSDSTISAAEGVSAQIFHGTNGCCATLSGPGAFSLVHEDMTFTNSVTHWFDFSRVDMQRYPGEGTTTEHANKTLNGNPYVERVLDWRDPALLSLWNRRMYQPNGSLEFVQQVYTCRKTGAGAAGDMAYLSIPSDGSRRLPLSLGSGYNSFTSNSVQTAVMVFGSQDGGGQALLGTSYGALARSGTTTAYGITTNTNHDVWVDGVQVDPTASGTLNGGWQIVTISMDGEFFNSLGVTNGVSGGPFGGQNYGELLLFGERVTERQRLEAEIYLADKWGISGYAAAARARYRELARPATNRITLVESAALRPGDGALLLEGACSGTVELSGGTLLSAKPAFTEDDIPSEGRLYWIDADDEATLTFRKDVYANDKRPDEVVAVRDKTSASFEAGKPIAYGVSSRTPVWRKVSFDGGPLRGWIDFNLYYSQWPETYGSDTAGKTLRFFEYADDFKMNTGTRESTGAQPSLAAMNTRTAFVAQNSSHGGGTPLLDTVSGTGSIVQRTSGVRQSLWGNGPSQFSGGVNRINGIVIDQSKGFSGRPEVYTLRATGAFNVPFIDCYGHSENKTYNDGKGAIIGEMLYYSCALPDDTVYGIESYLMKKWLNRLPSGFTDMSRVRVGGAGSVSVEDPTCRPSFDPSFQGTFSSGGARAFEMAVNPSTGEVVGSLVAPDAAFDLPSECTLRVSFAEPPSAEACRSVYTLLDCGSLARQVAWTLVAGENMPGTAKLVQKRDGCRLLLVPKPRGMVISVR